MVVYYIMLPNKTLATGRAAEQLSVGLILIYGPDNGYTTEHPRIISILVHVSVLVKMVGLRRQLA